MVMATKTSQKRVQPCQNLGFKYYKSQRKYYPKIINKRKVQLQKASHARRQKKKKKGEKKSKEKEV